MILRELDRQLDRVTARLRTERLLWHGAALSLIVATIPIAGWCLSASDAITRHSVLGSLIAVVALPAVFLARSAFRRRTHVDVARRIERSFPDLRACLLAAVDQTPDAAGQLGILQRQVVYDALAHARNNDWRRAVSNRRLLCATSAQCACLAIPLLVFLLAGPSSETSLSGSTRPAASEGGQLEFRLTVDPGDATLERGTSLPILARFASVCPGAAKLIVETADLSVQAYPLTKSLDDPVFGGRLPEAQYDLKYRIEYDGHTSRDYQVKVFDYPAVLQADATITFPEWTGLPETKLEDIRRVSVPEGAMLTLSCRLNKNMASIEVKDDDGTSLGGMTAVETDAEYVPPNAEAARAHAMRLPSEEHFACGVQPTKSGKWRVELWDADGRTSREPFEVAVEVVPNRRPELKVSFPARDVRVSPIEELTFEGTAWDDFGLVEYGLVYNVAGRRPVIVPLGKDHAGREPQTLAHLIALEDLKVEPDELVSWHFYADDRAPDGKVRRTVGDMFFAEVRHFEEIFRQGQAPPGGGGPQGGGGENEQKAEQLAEQQKQIVTATWNVLRKAQAAPTTGDASAKNVADAASVGGTLRREPTLAASATGSSSLGDDLRLLHESQQKLFTQSGEFAQKLRDAKSQQFLRTALDQMQRAATALETAAKDNRPDTLPDALVAEQSAYQALLKLRAREHNVVEQSGGGGGGGGSGRSQQQLQQLELTNQQNRYQTDKQAKTEAADPAKREQLQVLNRLRELARRQADVNEKLRDLERALRDAKTETEQAELQRQLKRLRDEQQQALRDVDELRDRMDRPENQREMSESRQQLDQARDRIRQTSEALKDGQVSKALSSGVRSERDLDKLREDFRKKTANKFADDMNRLRTQARDLASKEDAIRQQLQPSGKEPKEPRKSLRTKNENEAAGKALAEQKEKLNELLDGMKRVVEQSEASEPLLSKQLYDTARTARDQQPAEQLDAAAKSLRQNRPEEAAAAEAQARKGIDSLRKGIERAAESVLGDETESLRRASKELSDLTRAVDRESARASGKSGEKPLQTADASGSEPGAKNEERGTKSGGRETPSGAKPGKSPGAPSKDPKSESGQQPGESQQPGSKEGSGGSGEKSDGTKPSDQAGNQAGAKDPSGSATADSSGSSASAGDKSGEAGGKPDGSSSGSKSGGSNKTGSQQASRQSPSRGSESPGAQGGSSGGAGEGPGSAMQPLTGRDFQEWSDRLRDVEEMLSDGQLKSDVARIRDRARTMRAEFKRHSQEPNWDLVRTQIVEPLTELQLRVAEDLARRESSDSLTPIDRDPVPDRYSDLVKRYYERLGK